MQAVAGGLKMFGCKPENIPITHNLMKLVWEASSNCLNHLEDHCEREKAQEKAMRKKREAGQEEAILLEELQKIKKNFRICS
ncbi:hypothetical protein QYM36_008810 [Artemia franciscana]|uniref:Uncharacterized protein n=1 Tax=Artemia franciscana TaxID=6661 RepID=A0AA88HRH7_ARTSF|nr:hypothetical protein QYM36_008810 [Artemia franciscana]